MRSALFAILALVLCGAPAVAAVPVKKQPGSAGQFTSPEQILRWINGYRAHPNPARVSVAVKAMSELGLFRELETAGVYIGFMAGILEANAGKAEEIITKWFPMPPEDQVAIVRAIAYSNHPQWKELLHKFAERMPARKVLIDRFVTGKQPTLKQMPLDNGAGPLDMLWGQYFATGSYEPVLRMISILPWANDVNKVDRLTVGSMAKLTLATNASRDKDLLDLLKSSLRHEGKDIKPVLQEVIDAAETFEFGKVRKDAMAAIDQLKIKGPASTRNAQWWGQAGQTALALGCIVASAMGHMEVGIPCVVGGAVSGAALKYLLPQ